jgi:pyruvate/2-oxoglutarate dehydrogenase complex dihydrolipoamide dehydrogenase (E3) component
MAEAQHVDVLVFGSGEAGKYVAWTMAKAGFATAVVERKLIGGACPNIACLPSKNIIHSAKVAELHRRGPEFGLGPGPSAVAMTGVAARKRRMVEELVAIHLERYRESGAELILGEGRFVDTGTVEVQLQQGGTRRLRGDRVFLNLGTRATIPNVPGIEDAGALTHVEALDLDRLPEHLIVLGGGFVGLELSQAMRRFGARVTIVEHGAQLAPREDADVAGALLELFRDEGIDVRLETAAVRVEGRTGENVRLTVRGPDGPQTIEGSDLLVATGRTPNTGGIGLEIAGVALDGQGYIKVNERLETTAAGTWALGDCAGPPFFTHKSFDDFRIVRDNLLHGDARMTRDRLIPFCVFTDPQLARVGPNETEARARGIDYRIAQIPMAAVLRTRTLTETRGFMKALVEVGSDRILGFTAFGPEAGELMSVVQVAMLAGLPYTGLRDAILTHPTMAGGLTVLFANPPRPGATAQAAAVA